MKSLQKTKKKQAEFEAEEKIKKNTEREEELRQKVKVKAEEHALLQRFETLKTIEKNMGRMVSVDREQEDVLESEGSESTDFEEHPYFGWIPAPKISKRPRHDIDAGKNSVKRARSDIDAGRK